MGEASIVTRERSWFGDADRRRRSLRLTPHPRQGVTRGWTALGRGLRTLVDKTFPPTP